MSGLPAALVAQARPIGRGASFHPPATGPVIGRCRHRLGARGVHVELFAANRVVLVPAGIGTRPPRGFSAGRVSRARCYGDLVTLEPTGVVLVRPGARLLLSDLFRAWGQTLSPSRLASFPATAGTRVAGSSTGDAGAARQAVCPDEAAEIVLACAACLVAIYVCQEFLEGLFATGHPAGLVGVFDYGGWWSVPAAVGVGLVIAAAFHGGSQSNDLARAAITAVPKLAAAGVTVACRRTPLLGAQGREPVQTGLLRSGAAQGQ